MINDVDPGYDVCSVPKDQAMMTGKNIGDLLNAAGVTWGGFMGGFNLETKNANGTTGCKRSTHSAVVGKARGRLHPASQLVPVFRIDRQSRPMRGPRSAAAIGHSSADGKTPIRRTTNTTCRIFTPR